MKFTVLSKISNRRQFSLRMASVGSLVGLSGLISPVSASAAQSDEISSNQEAIHQETLFKAAASRVYKALTEAKEFAQITELSMPGGAADISGEVGGAFSLFGGHITGRHIELVPNERIVQAWRDGGWAPGVYSIARFELHPSGSETRLIFDHTGFPRGSAAHLAEGWKSHYWEPLAKYLGTSK